MLQPLSVCEPQPVFSYREAEMEEVACNLCAGRDVEAIGERDRNGLAVRSVICRHCGLIFLSPRMTPAWYGRYYEVEYRRQMVAFHRNGLGEHGPAAIFRRQLRHGAFLVQYLRQVCATTPRSILEIGSSAGGLLQTLRAAFDADVLGIEPGPEEAAFAQKQGIPVTVGLFEAIRLPSEPRFDLVLCTQSFNHLLDPRGVAERIGELLKPDGVFLLECQNFFHLCRFWGERDKAIQIDHTYMFVPATLHALVEAAGLEVLPETMRTDLTEPARELRRRRRLGIPSLHVRFLARLATPQRPALPQYGQVKAELERLPHQPRWARLARSWERQLMRVDNARERLRRFFRKPAA